MKLPVRVHEVALGAARFKVIRPARPLRHAVLTDRDHYLNASLDAEAAQHIGALWTLAATSPRTLIHIPLRTNQPPPDELEWPGARRLDLVLLHHSLQFAPSRWKEVRARLGQGRPQTVDLPKAPPASEPEIDYDARHHRENRDLFHQHVHAETLFMTGSAKVFGETARHFLDVAREGPGQAIRHPSSPHYCRQFHWNDGTLGGDARELHIEYCDQWRAQADLR
ncbi:hypothetical protein [Streptomyces sp. NPDC050738]|uniref:hypothetical protein n=1 Tax=Streptomyces sp. NPDC050738 TaxID=3154744 RepID=UPI00341DBABC